MSDEHVGVIEDGVTKKGSLEERVTRLEREVAYDGRSLGMLSGLTALQFSRTRMEHEDLRQEMQSLSSALGSAMIVCIGLSAVCVMLVHRVADVEDALDALRRSSKAN